MFADDTSVYLKGETISETINIFNSELQNLNLWLAAKCIQTPLHDISNETGLWSNLTRW